LRGLRPLAVRFRPWLLLAAPGRRQLEAAVFRRRLAVAAGGHDDVVDDAVLLGFLGAHEEVALGVPLDLLDRLPGVRGEHLVERLAHPQDLPRMDLNVRRLALEPAGGLVDQDAGVRQGEPHAFGTAGQQHRRHAGGEPHAHGRDPRTDVAHGVIDGQPGGNHAPGAVDVDVDVLVRVFGSQEEQLRHDDVGNLVVDWCADEDDAVLEEPRVDIKGALATVGGLDHHRDERLRLPGQPFGVHA